MDPALAGPAQVTEAPISEKLAPVPDVVKEEMVSSANPAEDAKGSVKSTFRGMEEGYCSTWVEHPEWRSQTRLPRFSRRSWMPYMSQASGPGLQGT
jgi:hypothetical protein